MAKVVKIGDEAYDNLKAMSDRTGSSIQELVTQTVMSKGDPVINLSKPITIKPDDLCKACQDVIENKLPKDPEVKKSGSGWVWLLIGLLALVYIGDRVTKQQTNQYRL